jgi:aminocarboxymuconate-semialdehyde decarboxylase
MASPPAHYLSRIYFDCLVHDERSLALLIERAGVDKVLAGTDFPATGDIPGGAMRWIRSCKFLSADDKEKILWRNALAFLGVERAGRYVSHTVNAGSLE